LAEHHFRINEFCKNIEQTAYYAKMNDIEPIYFHGTSLAAGFTKEEVTGKATEHAKKLVGLLNDIQ